MATTAVTHIELDDNGVAWIDDTKVKVIEVAIDKLVHGSSPEEMHFQYPHLSLAQIHAALAYYYDHQAELDAEIKRRWLEANELATKVADSSFHHQLLTLKNTRTKTELRVKVYRRRKGHDIWHWCRTCSSWPTLEYEEKIASNELMGELCNECRGQERAGNCHP